MKSKILEFHIRRCNVYPFENYFHPDLTNSFQISCGLLKTINPQFWFLKSQKT